MKTILVLLTCLLSLTSMSQPKKIINDYLTLQNQLVSFKSEAEEIGKEIKNKWRNDSIKNLAKIQYTSFYAASTGVISSFETVIMKPRLINASRETIQKQVDDVNKKLGVLQGTYASGLAYIAKGGKFSGGTMEVVKQIIELGNGLYSAIKNFIDGQRQETANRFKTQTTPLVWEKL